MKLKQSLLAAFALVIITLSAKAQNTFPSTGSAGIGTTTPNASALLDMESTAKGLLIPQMTLTQRNAIATPATGLMIYQTTTPTGFYYYNGSAWVIASSQWLSSGSNLTYSTGDAVIHSLTVGTGAGSNNTNAAVGYTALGANTSGTYNTANGIQVLNVNTTGSNNTADGGDALESNTTGSYNTAGGSSALLSNGTGNNNTAEGYGALLYNNKGNSNTGIGYTALYKNTTGYSNVAVGTGALYSNTTTSNTVAIGDSSLYNNAGIDNTALGSKALYKNTNGENSTAIGCVSLYSNTTGLSNTATGYLSLYSNTTGSFNTATGVQALYLNTAGTYNTADGMYALYNNRSYNNTATGWGSLYKDSIGHDNTADGVQALYNNNTGVENTAEGSSALSSNTTGSYNVGNGYYTLYANQTGSYNTGLGFNALAETDNETECTAVGDYADGSNTYSNSSSFGNSATFTASNQIRLGNSSVTSIGGYAGWSNVSDGRVKTNIKQNVPGLAFINKLQPITYNLNLDAADKIIQPPVHKDKDGKVMSASALDMSARTAKQQVVYTGFIAQDVETAARSLNYDFSGVDAPKNSKDLYGLRYAEFVVPLVKAVQELSATNTDKQQQIDTLKQTNASLQSQINELKIMMQQLLAAKGDVVIPSQNISLTSASLQQNIPNPYNQSTTIHYSLPAAFTSAHIIITDNTGKTLKQIPVTTTGAGTVNINAGSLSAGIYNYSLIVDGAVIDTKKMVLAK